MKTKNELIKVILEVCVVNAIPTTGDLFFSLAFRSVKELKEIAKKIGV